MDLTLNNPRRLSAIKPRNQTKPYINNDPSKRLSKFIWPIDGTLIAITTQSGLESNGNGDVLYISQSTRTGDSPSNSV